MSEPSQNPMDASGRVFIMPQSAYGFEINGGSRYPWCVLPGVKIADIWWEHSRLWNNDTDWENPRNKNIQN